MIGTYNPGMPAKGLRGSQGWDVKKAERSAIKRDMSSSYNPERNPVVYESMKMNVGFDLALRIPFLVSGLSRNHICCQFLGGDVVVPAVAEQ
jgi:hypothetical protein